MKKSKLNPLWHKFWFTSKKEGFIVALKKIGNYLKDKYSPSEPKEYDFAYNVLDQLPGEKVLVDVGAATGTSIMKFATSNWRIFAFEPDKKNRAVLESVFNKYPNVIIDPRAVTEKTIGEMEFYTSEISLGISSLSAFHPSHVGAYKVDTIGLRDYLKEFDLEKIELLKIDTEGYDYFVLKGFPWENYIPEVIICEFEDKKTKPLGYTWQDLADFLVEKGYRIIISEFYPIKEYGGDYHWRRFIEYPNLELGEHSWGNMLAASDNAVYGELLQACRQFEKKISH